MFHLKSLALFMGVSLLSAACSKMELSNFSSEIPLEIEALLHNHVWNVFKYDENGKNRTSEFDSYKFVFLEDGYIYVSDLSKSFVGSWSIKIIKTKYVDKSGMKFILHFDPSPEFKDLNKVWTVKSSSKEFIELCHLTNGSGNDVLKFSKINTSHLDRSSFGY